MMIIWIEANIGAGKSAFLESMKKVGEEKVAIVPERVPLDHLQKFYSDFSYAFAFQLIMASERWIAHDEAITKEIEKAKTCSDCGGSGKFTVRNLITGEITYSQDCKTCKGSGYINRKLVFLERSLEADTLFAQINNKLGNINDLDLERYLSYKKVLLQNYRKPDAIIYLRSTPEGCFNRIMNVRPIEQPERKCESTISLDYLKLLHEYHDNWLLYSKDITPILIYNTETNDWRDKNIAKNIYEDIKFKLIEKY